MRSLDYVTQFEIMFTEHTYWHKFRAQTKFPRQIMVRWSSGSPSIGLVLFKERVKQGNIGPGCSRGGMDNSHEEGQEDDESSDHRVEQKISQRIE